MFSPLTSVVYSGRPDGGRPVGVWVAGLSPLATIVPPLPAETPVRIDQSATVTSAKSIRLFDQTRSSVQPAASVTVKSSYTWVMLPGPVAWLRRAVLPS